MSIQEIRPELESTTPLQKFYAEQNVLITGGTGFLGKLLIQKLLRSCPHISTIYLIIRPKKGQDVEQRLESIFDDPVFNRLKNEVPKFRHKIMVISGDCSCPDLGISVTDKELIMREVSIVFNVAATVRFDEKIKAAVTTNINCAKEMMNLCRKMENLKVAIHVSTAYSNCIRKDIEERIYEPPLTGDNAFKVINSLDDEKLDAITPTLIGQFPNTYTYTKCIAEQVIQQYGKHLPAGIFRPAIVTSSYQDPVPGWVANYNGPIGMIAAVGLGLLKTLRLNDDCTTEVVPVDYTVNALLATAWDVANNKNQDADPLVYNYTTWTKKVSWSQYLQMCLKYGKMMPANNSIWCYNLIIARNMISYYFLVFFLHFVPGLIVDTALFITGKKPRMLKIYKKIHKFSCVTSYFGMYNWNFNYNNIKTLWGKLTAEDQNLFCFSMDNIDWDHYCKVSIEGLRLYIFKEEPETIPAARKRMKRILILNKFIIYTFVALSLWVLYSIFSYSLSFGARSELTTISESIISR